MIVVSVIIWPILQLLKTFKIHQLLCFIVAMTLYRFVAGQWKVASQSCLNAHNGLSSEITFMANCPKAKGVQDADDRNDKRKHQCFIMRRHCAKKCKGKDGTCPATSLFTLNLKVDKQTKAFESVECVCSFSEYISSCTGEYTDSWSDVENEFNEKCATDDTTTSTTATTTAPKKGCSKLPYNQAHGGTVRYLSPTDSNNKVRHGDNVTITGCTGRQAEGYICPASLPADCIKSSATFTCNDGIWSDFEPTQCIKSFKEMCRYDSAGHLLSGICIGFDGGQWKGYEWKAYLRDVKERQCIGPTKNAIGGRLMTQKNETQLDQIVEAAKSRKNVQDRDKDKKYLLFVQLSENLKTGQVLRFQGVTPEVTSKDISDDNYQSFQGGVSLEGRIGVGEYPQHASFSMRIDYSKDSITFDSFPQGPTGQQLSVSPDTKTFTITQGLQQKENFDFTIEINDMEFLIKFGSTEKSYPYFNRSLHYINLIYFYGRAFKLDSATLDGKVLMNGDEDMIYDDCLLVGLTKENPNGDPKVGWVWEDGKSAKPDETPWDADEPDNKNGDELYACLNRKTKKLRDISSLLKRSAICEYEDQTKARKTEKRKKREVEIGGKHQNQENMKTTKHLNLEL